MTSKFLPVLTLALSIFIMGCSKNMGRPFAGGAAAQTSTNAASGSDSPLILSIALLNSQFNGDIYVDIASNDHFHVVITNISKKPLNIFKEDNSWGSGALSFELQDEKGNKYKIQQVGPREWTSNIPAYWVLKPGEHYVRDVCFAQICQGENDWTGFPALKHDDTIKVTMTAIFMIREEMAIAYSAWHGCIKSQPITCNIREMR